MTHPTRDEWAPYLFGEADPQTKARLASHLKGCPECAHEIAGWRRSLKRLDAWKLAPPPRAQAAAGPPALLKWAVAAALVLGLGFGWGRWSAFSAPQARRVLEAQWQRQLQAAQKQFDTSLAQARQELLRAAAAQSQEALAQLAETLEAERAEDQRALGVMYDALQRQHSIDFVALRKDLETVASRTDEEIRRARFQLYQLSAAAIQPAVDQQ
jgi:anti-sigma factor RsiW